MIMIMITEFPARLPYLISKQIMASHLMPCYKLYVALLAVCVCYAVTPMPAAAL